MRSILRTPSSGNHYSHDTVLLAVCQARRQVRPGAVQVVKVKVLLCSYIHAAYPSKYVFLMP